MNDRQPYEFFDHTADIGIRAEAPTLGELLVRMAQGLTELLVEQSHIEAIEERAVRLEAPDATSLLLAWLKELLYWFSAEGFLPSRYELTDVGPTSLRGVVRGERFDPQRHQQGREVKAITRHLLRVEERGGRWHGEVIVDI
ncbi:MAG: archease [Candidatus Omnitrophica bacterium CG11_big_fil_rev_8_21_14_0_20_63_9]|nr:MAG: archease [Candidatus Omnitrophica bacterium CG11_big_fil_rev_8_21_14_0_20_63_9]